MTEPAGGLRNGAGPSYNRSSGARVAQLDRAAVS